MSQKKERILLASAAIATDNELLGRVISATETQEELQYILCCVEMYLDADSQLEFSSIDNAVFNALWARQRIHERMDIWLKISEVREGLLDNVVIECLRTSRPALAKYAGQQKYVQIVLSFLKKEKGQTSHLTKILETLQSPQHTGLTIRIMRDIVERNTAIVRCILQLSRLYFVDLSACVKELFALDIGKDDILQLAQVIAQNI